jgi:Ca-activated chloride channel family protein
MSRDYAGLQRGSAGPEVVEVITQLGLEFRLMTQFTSFVAVEEMTITDGGQPRRIEVPVDMPEGVSYEGVFGADDLRQSRRIAGVSSAVMIPGTPKVRSERDRSAKPKAQVGSGRGAGAGAGSGGGVGGGTGRGVGPPAGQTYPGQPNLSGSLGLADRERQQPIPRLHPSLVALVERLKKRDPQPGADEARFVRNGKAEVQIWLTDNSAATMSKLKELGFEILLEPKTAKMVIGRLPIENLEALSKLTVVRYVAPMTN